MCRNIRKTDKQEYEISQFVYNIFLVINKSLESLNEIIIELDNFAPCLRIKFTKTKMVWISSKEFSKDVCHHSRWKLTWDNITFDLLVILIFS